MKQSQNQLAKHLGISKSYLSMILSGQRKPNEQLASRLCSHGLFTAQSNLVPSKQRVVGSNPSRDATKLASALSIQAHGLQLSR